MTNLPHAALARTTRTAYVAAAMMLMASVAAIMARPVQKVSAERAPISLKNVIPLQFGGWRAAPATFIQVVNPQTKELLDRLYSEILTRTYVNADGYRVMLSIAYGSDRGGALQAHKPEVCYPAQGFSLRANDAGVLATAFGEIPVRRLFAVAGARQEPLTYWFTIGDQAVQGTTQKKLVELKFGLTGRIPDGLLYRVSSIDADPARAYRFQDQFTNELLQALLPAERKRLSGLGGS